MVKSKSNNEILSDYHRRKFINENADFIFFIVLFLFLLILFSKTISHSQNKKMQWVEAGILGIFTLYVIFVTINIFIHLSQKQKAIAENWIEAWKSYVHKY